MASAYWTGAGSPNNDPNQDANWAPNEDGSGTPAKPAAGNDVFIQDPAVDILGLATGVTFNTFSYRGKRSLGSASTPYSFGCTNECKIEQTGDGGIYIGARSTAANGLANVNVISTGTQQLWIGDTGDITLMRVGSNCRVRIGTSVALAATHQLRSNKGSRVFYEAKASSTIPTIDAAGEVIAYRAITTAVTAGLLSVFGKSIAVAKATVAPGGIYNHQSSGTVTLLIVFPGGLTTAKGSAYAATITTAVNYTDTPLFQGSNNITISAEQQLAI